MDEPSVWGNWTEYLEGNTQWHYNQKLEESNFAIKANLFFNMVQNRDPSRLQMKKAWRQRAQSPEVNVRAINIWCN